MQRLVEFPDGRPTSTASDKVKVKVKICGVNSEAAFDAAAEAGADWIGFVFFRRSPRAVTPDQAARLSSRMSGGPLRVGLFVEPTDDEIHTATQSLSLDALQIYAPASRTSQIRERTGLPVWRAVPVSMATDLPDFRSGLDGLVIEPRPAPDATRPGGNATVLDWTMLRGWNAPLPWLLAGGLTPMNVAEAIVRSGARAVDVSSGVESGPGRKDPALIAAFIAAARATVLAA